MSNDLEIVVNPPAPVLKLTHKLPTAPHSAHLIDGLCDWAEGLPQANAHSKKRILVTWYGSFPGHGTVGDLLALEALVTHLVGRGHDVSHATGDAISITGSNCVRWDLAWPEDFDAVLFVCGPILNFHPLTNSLFERFSRSRLAGIGVSMMPEGHPYHSNPFQFVLAREGLSDRFGDLAILAPRPTSLGAVHRPKIGISLRGPQNEYGEHRCRWLETDELALKLARTAAARIDAEIITIENHLARSGRSASAIETQYSECNLVITSRFHGAISALRAEVPFIAIDQIEGGAKLMSLLSPLPWPHTYSIDRLDADQLRNVSIQLVEQPHDPLLFATRQLCIRTANETLATLDDWLCSLV